MFEAELLDLDPRGESHAIVKSATELDTAIDEGKVAFMHCVEGGFHLGGEAAEIDARVAELAARGVVYITLAHLFYRGIATNAPALPFLSDAGYNKIFCQPRGYGLSGLGVAAVKAMYEHSVLIDVSHMSQRALDDTFDLLEELDDGADPGGYPVIASHAGYRFGAQEYMLGPETIARIAERDGVIDLILAQHQLNEGAGVADPTDRTETPETVRKHIEAIRDWVPGRSLAHVGIGSDLDGFINPTAAGIEMAGDLRTLRGPLEAAYPAEAEAIMSGNALRVARRILERRD